MKALKSLKKPAVRGTLWIVVNYGVSQSLRFGSNLILTRLLIPEFFGLMALVNTLRIGLELLSDLGIDQSIIQNKRGDDPEFLNTAWTLKIIRGIFLWLLCLAITVPVAQWYEDDRLRLLIPIVGLTTIFEGLTSTSLATLNRRMQLGLFTLFELAIQIFNLTVMIVWSWFSPSIWVLSVGNLSGVVLQMVASHFLLPNYRNRLGWDKDAFAVIFKFGKGMFFATGLMFLADQADRFLLGKLISFEALGVYAIAFTLATLPTEVLKNLSYRVLFPTAAKNAERPRGELRASTAHQRSLILLATAVGLAFLVSFGDYAISLLYDDRYIAATWMLPVMAFGVWFSALFYTATPAILAIGQPVYTAYSNFGRLMVIVFGVWFGYQAFGTSGAVIGVALGDLAAYSMLYYGLLKEKLSFAGQDFQLTGFYFSVLAAVLVVRYGLGLGLPIDVLLQSR